MQNTIKNHNIIVSAQQGNTKAINKLYDLYYPMVTRYVSIKINKRNVSVDDVVIVTMGKALININTFDLSHEFSTWVLKIAENVCIDELRKTKHQTLSINANDSTGKEFAENITDYSMSAHQRMEKEERISNLLLAIEKLSPSEKQCLLLQIEGKKMEEMACELSLSIGAIKSKIHRAKEKLSKMQLS